MSTITYPNNKLDPTTAAFTASAIVTIVLSMVLTIVKELNPSLLALMKNISVLGVKHHWLVHGLVIVALFYLLGWLFSKSGYIQNIYSKGLTNMLIWSAIISSIGIFGFFLIELFE